MQLEEDLEAGQKVDPNMCQWSPSGLVEPHNPNDPFLATLLCRSGHNNHDTCSCGFRVSITCNYANLYWLKKTAVTFSTNNHSSGFPYCQ